MHRSPLTVRRRQRRHRLFLEALERRDMLASDWQNPLFNLDVDDNGSVAPLDALIVINDLNELGSRQLLMPFDDFSTAARYLDSSGEGDLSPLDAVLIINSLNAASPVPTIELALAADNGASQTDRITNDPSIRGSVLTAGSPILSARIRANRENVVPLPMSASGDFIFDPRSIPDFDDGANRIAVAVTLASGGTGLRQFHFSYDSIPPVFVPPHLATVDDTGFSATDNVTKITNPRLQAAAEAGSQLVVRLDGQLLADLNSTGSWETELPSLADGKYEVTASATDVAGNISQTGFPITVTIDTVSPAAAQLDLASTSDTGVKGDHQTGAARVTLIGTTEGNAFVALEGMAQSARAANDGRFRFPGIALASGINTLTAHVVDLAGNTGPDSQTTLTQVVEAGVTDPVVRWNNAALAAIRLDASDPLEATRTLAMMSQAIYDVVNAVDGTPSLFVRMPVPVGLSPEAAASAAAFEILESVYPAQQAALSIELAAALSEIADGQAKSDGITFGQAIARAIIALRKDDGWDAFVDYRPREIVGQWRETAPMYAPATKPQWENVRTFVVASADPFVPSGPPDLTSSIYSHDFQEVASLGRVNSMSRTADQTQIARFWSDGPGTTTPPGHWNAIASTVTQSAGSSWGENARLFAELNTALGDAAIVAWKAKYSHEFWRPITAIQQADRDDNGQTTVDRSWSPLLITPPFPEYVSGHSTFSGTAARILTENFGASVAFTTTSPGLPDVERSFANFEDAADEAGRSRIYGGIHFEFSNRDGQVAGRAIAEEVLSRFSSTDDLLPPTIVFNTPKPGRVSNSNPAIEGWVIDNLSGVRGLQAAFDGGAYASVDLDSEGRFSFPTQFALTGSDDGPHVVHFRAIDQAGLVSPDVAFPLTIDTTPPSVLITGLTAGAVIDASTLLTGTANGTGSPVTSLAYKIDAGPLMPLPFDRGSGAFRHRLDLSQAMPGAHTLTVIASDGAGLLGEQSLVVILAQAIPFVITATSPPSGSSDVGTTIRPRIDFSRPVDGGSLNDTNLFATGPDGAKLPATIVPAADGSFAWLFFEGPMPSGALITLHLDGSTILAASDGMPLDADGDGDAGGLFQTTFQTVSLAPLFGTSLSGKVVDPGADLSPMTFDDLRAGADGALHTADDLFLSPLAGVTLHILGLESQVAVTDAAGNFHFEMVPAGNVKLAIDGRTATNVPADVYFPEMVMDLNLRAGASNTVMGSMGTLEQQRANADRAELYLPRLRTDILRTLSTTDPTVIAVDPESAPGLTAEQRSLLTITVPPGLAIGHDGQPLVGGQVGISTVPAELVRDMLPPGLSQHTFDITIQAPGIDRFTTPVPMTFPNLMGSPPGSQLNFLSFDHATGRLVIEGTATVSADGLTVHTDPGTGITHPGWHGLMPPGGEVKNGSGGPGPSGDPPQNCRAAVADVETSGLQNYFFKDDTGTFTLGFRNNASDDSATNDECSNSLVEITITVEGVADEFLTGLSDQTFELPPGGNKQIRVDMNDMLDRLPTLERDQMWGIKVQVTGSEAGSPGSTLVDESFYVYRFVDAADAVTLERATDGIVVFADTLVDGFGGIQRKRVIDQFAPQGVQPEFSILDLNFDTDEAGNLVFDPQVVGNLISGTASVLSPAGDVVGTLQLKGDGTPKIRLDINKAQFKSKLDEIVIDSLTTGGDVEPIVFTAAERALLDSDALRDAFADDLATLMIAEFENVSAGIELGSGPNSIVLNFESLSDRSKFGASRLPAPGDGIDIGRFDGVDDYRADVTEFLTDLKVHSRAVQNFMLSQLMNQSFQTNVTIYADNLIETNSGQNLNLSRTQMLQLFKKTAVHEAGHTLGLIHTAQAEGALDTISREIQSITLSGGGLGDTFTLSFNGATTVPLRFDAEVSEVSDALAQLPTTGPATIFVDAPGRGGPYTLKFQLDFSGLDVPLVTGIGTGTLNVSSVTVSPGSIVSHPTTVPGGNNDIMYGGFLDTLGSTNFQPGLSQDGLKVGLHLDWTTEEAQNVITFWAKHLAASNGAFFDALESSEESELQASLFPGPHVFIVDDSGQIAFHSLDLGTASADGPSDAPNTRTLTISNIGSERVVLDSITAQSVSNAFSASPVAPGTTLEPGAEVNVSIAFDPTSSGDDAGYLSIVSNDPTLPTRIDLTGRGVSTHADLLVDVVNNNLGGQPTGAGAILKKNAVALRNMGASPLSISDVRFVSGSEFAIAGLPVGFGPGQPLVIGPGESFKLDASFNPGTLGLRRGVLEIVSNDPDAPVTSKTLVGTGLANAGSALDYGNDYVALQTHLIAGAPALRQRSDAAGNWSFFLPANEAIHSVIFDPASGLISHSYDVTELAGQSTELLPPVFLASTATDSDGDGLPDDIEFAVGTGLKDADTDDDGLSDYVEIAQGLDPLGGLGLPTGIVAAATLQGQAFEVVVEGSLTDPNVQTAFVATGPYGLAIVDVTQPGKPILQSELNLLGVNFDVAVDLGRNLAVLAAGSRGLHLVDISDLSSPVLAAEIPMTGSATRLELSGGTAYVAVAYSVGSAIVSFDLNTREVVQTLPVEGSITDLALDGRSLYFLDKMSTLHALSLDGPTMTRRGSLTIDGTKGQFAVGDGIAYIPAARGQPPSDGFVTVDVSDPSTLTLIGDAMVPPTAFGSLVNDFTVTGSGLGLKFDLSVPGFGNPAINVLDVYVVADPSQTNEFVTRIQLPDLSRGLTIGKGYAFVADNYSGLQVVNFQPLDTAGQAPVVAASATDADRDPVTPGIQVKNGATFAIDARVLDDVLVRNVELLVNGQVVRNDASFPWDLVATAPVTNQAVTLSIQARATDTGGNTGLSNLLTIEVIPDLVAPALIGSTPSPGQIVPRVELIDLLFDEALDASLLQAAAVTLINLGPDNVIGGDDDTVVPISSLSLRDQDLTLRLAPDPELQTPGQYRLLINPSILADIAGNHLLAPVELSFSIPARNPLTAARGIAADPTLPSANPGQEFSFVMPWAPELARTRIVRQDSDDGTRYSAAIPPRRSDLPTRTAYFRVDLDAMTADAAVFGGGHYRFTDLPNWTVNGDALDLYGRDSNGNDFQNQLPGNGLYVGLGNPPSGNSGPLESKTQFPLEPGEYQLQFDLAGARNSITTESVLVSLGSAFSETISRPALSLFSSFTRTFTVPAAVSARLVFDQVGTTSEGLSLDNVKLTRVDSGTVLLDDNFDLPFSDGNFLLQIVPTLDSVDVLSISNSGTTQTAMVLLSGTGLIEGENTTYQFGNTTVVDTSFTTGPDVLDDVDPTDPSDDFRLNGFATLSVPLADAAFGAISVSTAGGRSDWFSVNVSSISAQALSGTPTNPALLSANPGQSITLHGDGLTLATDIEVQYHDANGRLRSELINPTSAELDGSAAQVILPDVVNGVIRLRIFGAPTIYSIQIVPVVHQGIMVFQPSPQPIFVRIYGRGFYDGDSTYDFDGMLIYDNELTNYANLQGNTIAEVLTSVSENVPLTVTTPGGTSAPVTVNVPVPTEVSPPTITAIVSTAFDGVPTNPAINSANTGQVITVQGTNFGLDSLQVVFSTINESGIEGVEAVAPLAVNDAGTLAQVRVPDLASTGSVYVTSIGSRHFGLNDASDAIHRNIEVSFTPTASTTHLRFADGGLSGLAEEGWGIDNVQVSQNIVVVFSDDFQGLDRPEWSRSTTETTPGLSRFSGPFSSSVQKLSLSGLIVGAVHILRFDLYVLDTWDGLAAGYGPDRFIVRADDETLFDEAFSNDSTKSQTFVRGQGIPLQIVPTITGTRHQEGLGYDGYLQISGSGFAEGAGTITIGGVDLHDHIKPDTADVSLNPFQDTGLDPVVFYASNNMRYGLATKAFTLDGPIRVATAGGYFEIAGPERHIATSALVNSVNAVAREGIPHDPSLLSANTGEFIKLSGAFYEFYDEADFKVLFEFQAIDDTGTIGTVTRAGNGIGSGPNGREWEVIVPELARTGMVRILGTPIAFFLQVVPTLRDVGPIVPGMVTVLEGTGLLQGDLSLSVDGQPVASYAIQTVREWHDGRLTNYLTDRQMVTFTVPAGVTSGVIKAVTSGGTAMLRYGVAAVAGPPLLPTGDVGDTLGSALPVSTSINSRFTITSDLEARPTPAIDEDFYQFTFEAGERIVFDLASESSTASSKRVNMQLQGASGNILRNTATSSNSEVRLEYKVPTSGNYILRVFDRDVGLPTENYQVYVRRLAADSTVLTGIEATAERGTPRHTEIASVNVGQIITLFGNGLRINDRIAFNKGQLDSESGSSNKSILVAPLSVSADGTSLTVQVPPDVTNDEDDMVNTGTVQLSSDAVGLFLQVVPTVDQIKSASGRSVYLLFSGFDYPAIWQVGDRNFVTDHDNSHNLAGLTYGPISVTTVGGTTAPLAAPDMISIAASATLGVPANPLLPSANPGQTIVVNGSRLKVAKNSISADASNLVIPTIDAAGVRKELSVAPTTASPDGTSMTIVVPSNAVTGPVGIMGDPQGTSFILQIVPVVTSILPSTTTVQVNGKGLIEGGTLYRFGDLEVLDASASTAGANVDRNSNDRAIVTAAVVGGTVTVTTAGGTSAPLSFGALRAQRYDEPDSLISQQSNSDTRFTDEILQGIITDAHEQLSEVLDASGHLAEWPHVDWQVTDLPGDLLGFFAGQTVFIDRDAAGWGWFVDRSLIKRSESNPIEPEQESRMDLLTVVLHELGHVLGLDHEDGGLMSEFLVPGQRLRRQETELATLADLCFEKWDDLHSDFHF